MTTEVHDLSEKPAACLQSAVKTVALCPQLIAVNTNQAGVLKTIM